MTVHLFPTQPRLSEPVPAGRGWLILGFALASWGLLVGLGYVVRLLIGGVL